MKIKNIIVHSPLVHNIICAKTTKKRTQKNIQKLFSKNIKQNGTWFELMITISHKGCHRFGIKINYTRHDRYSCYILCCCRYCWLEAASMDPILPLQQQKILIESIKTLCLLYTFTIQQVLIENNTQVNKLTSITYSSM